jgi:hypothetical protein
MKLAFSAIAAILLAGQASALMEGTSCYKVQCQETQGDCVSKSTLEVQLTLSDNCRKWILVVPAVIK